MPAERAPVLRKYDPKQTLLLPPDLNEWPAEDHLARVIAQVVDEGLDLEPFLATYRNAEGGSPAFDPRLRLEVLLYDYAIGVVSPRRQEKASYDDGATPWLAADQHPHFTSLARFCQRNLLLMDGLFHQVLLLRRGAGLTKLGRVA